MWKTRRKISPPEEDGVEHRAEPASWLPEGTTPDAAAAGKDATKPQDAVEDAPYVPRQDGPYGPREGSATYQQGTYGMEPVSESSYSPAPGSQYGGEPPKLAYQGGLSPDPSPPAAPVSAGYAGVAAPPAHTGGQGQASSAPPRGKPVPPAASPFASYRTARGRGQTSQARRANLVVARLEPWSVMKFSFLMSLVAWVVLFVAVALLYYALAGLGVFDAIQRAFQGVTASQGSAGVNLGHWLSASRVLGYTMLIGAMNVVLITALSTVGAVIYNLVSYLGRGIEITLKEPE
jgi:hypothetical protein